MFLTSQAFADSDDEVDFISFKEVRCALTRIDLQCLHLPNRQVSHAAIVIPAVTRLKKMNKEGIFGTVEMASVGGHCLQSESLIIAEV